MHNHQYLLKSTLYLLMNQCEGNNRNWTKTLDLDKPGKKLCVFMLMTTITTLLMMM